jgi:hypothetical protein
MPRRVGRKKVPGAIMVMAILSRPCWIAIGEHSALDRHSHPVNH